MIAHDHLAPVAGCFRCELNEDEPRYCEAETRPAVFYLGNGDPGYPAEYCEAEAEPGSDYCALHQDDGFPYDDRDAYDEARDLALDREDY